MKILSMTAAVALILGAAAAHARADIVFELVGVVFDDGGTLTGTFTTNDALNNIVSADITASASGTFSGFQYTYPGILFSGVLPYDLVLTSGDNVVFLVFMGGLRASGAQLNTVAPSDSREFENGRKRDVTTGSATFLMSVPEPTSIALVACGMPLAVMLGRRRRGAGARAR